MSTVAETATVAWGYTMAEIDSLARSVARYTIGRGGQSFYDCYDDAWSGIVEKLYHEETTERPHRVDLLRAGRLAVAEQWTERAQAHGLSQDLTAEGTVATRPAFQKYWRTVAAVHDDDFTDHIAERLALPQLLSLLTAEEYQAVAALAAHGKKEAAANALGIHLSTLTIRLRSARQAIKEAWFAPETPRQPAARGGDTCRSGHSRAKHGRRVQQKNGTLKWECQACRLAARKRKGSRRNSERHPSTLIARSLGVVDEVSTTHVIDTPDDTALEDVRRYLVTAGLADLAGPSRRRNLSTEELDTIGRMRAEGIPVRVIAETLNRPLGTIYRVLAKDAA